MTKKRKKLTPEQSSYLSFKLGDIVEFQSPMDVQCPCGHFVVQYIDTKKAESIVLKHCKSGTLYAPTYQNVAYLELYRIGRQGDFFICTRKNDDLQEWFIGMFMFQEGVEVHFRILNGDVDSFDINQWVFQQILCRNPLSDSESRQVLDTGE